MQKKTIKIKNISTIIDSNTKLDIPKKKSKSSTILKTSTKNKIILTNYKNNKQKIPQTPAGSIIGKNITPNKENQIILGIDPGLHFLGIGIIEIKPNNEFKLEKNKKKGIIAESLLPLITQYTHLYLQIKTARSAENKLYYIYKTISEFIEKYDPKLIIIEDSFVGFNKNSAIKLGLSRGSILAAVGKYNKPVEIIPPAKIKMELTQKGNATKEEIEEFFQKNFYNWTNNQKLDSSDALAAAFCGIKFLIDY